MVVRYLSKHFAVIRLTVSEFTDDDGRHTMDASARGVALLCSSTKQS